MRRPPLPLPARRACLVLVPALLLTACGGSSPSASSTSTSASTSTPSPATSSPAQARSGDAAGEVQVLASGLEAPWGLAFLPGGDALVSERDSGRVLRVPASGGAPQEVARLDEARPAGEGGLLGLAPSPSYATDGLVYAYVTTADDNRVVRFRLGGPREPVLTGIPKGMIHNGGRLAFGPDGALYAGTGDTGDRSLAQDPASLGGKVLRMTPDGQPVPGASSVVFSTGHRNVQGLTFDPQGRLWATEFGQDRFDEVNQVREGDDGGWPVVEGASDDPRFAAPVVTWRTSDASPSGVAWLGGSLWVAALRGQRLWQVPLGGADGTAAGSPVAHLQGTYGRLRATAAAPDGSLWVLTSNRDGRGQPTADDDRVLRLTPAVGAPRT